MYSKVIQKLQSYRYPPSPAQITDSSSLEVDQKTLQGSKQERYFLCSSCNEMRGPSTDRREKKCPKCGSREKIVDAIRITEDEHENLIHGNSIFLWCNRCSAKRDMIHIKQKQLQDLTISHLDEVGPVKPRFIYVPVNPLTLSYSDEYVVSCQKCDTWYVAYRDREDQEVSKHRSKSVII